MATPPWVAVEAAAFRDLGAGAALGVVTERVGLPCVVKPSRSGSALGVGFVERQADLAGAVMAALAFSGAVVVEAKIEGSEIAAGVVGSPLEALPLVEIVPKGACTTTPPATRRGDRVLRARTAGARIRHGVRG